jgi:DNA-binding CsgD family transcriptional regulator
VLAGAGDVTQARPMLEQSLAFFRQRGDGRGTARVLLSLGGLVARQGDLGSGTRLLEESLTMFRELGEGVGVALCSLLLGLPLPEGMLAEIGGTALRMWWRVSLGRDAPSVLDLQHWRIANDSAPAGPTQRSAAPDGLTPREIEILQLLAQRFTNREIANQLVLSVRTVERHIANLYEKTGVTNRRDALTYAHLHDLLPRKYVVSTHPMSPRQA